MNLTVATLQDADAIYAILAEEMHPENGVGRINPAKARARIELCITEGVVLLVKDGQEIAATAALYEAEGWWWSDDTYLTDCWNFVRKPYRRTRAAFILMQGIVDLARRAMPSPTLIGMTSKADQERKDRFFARYAEPAGTIYRVM